MNRPILVVATVAAAVIVAAAAVQLSTNRSSAPASPQPTSTIPTSVSTATPTAASAIPAAAVEDSHTDATFTLRIRAEPAAYRSGEPIHVTAWLTYAGPKAQEKLVGSSSGLILFSWEQEGTYGPRRQDGFWTADCAPYSIDRGNPRAVPFAKSGGVLGDGDEAEFWRQYFADPAFRLPAGRYRIHAVTGFSVGECGAPEHRLDASVEITVLP